MSFVRFFDPKSNVNFVGYFKVSWIATAALAALTIIGLLTLGMPWGIDFLGGTEMQIKFQKPVAANEIREALEDAGFEKNQVQQYGQVNNNEMLVRIEAIAALSVEEIDRIKGLLTKEFPQKEGQEGESLFFDKRSGNQLTIWLPLPYSNDLTDPMERKRLSDEQQHKLTHVLSDKAQIELRKSAAVGEKADLTGAVVADDPQGGRIRYTVHLAGVTNKIQIVLSEKFGETEIRRVDFVDSQVSRQLRTDGLLAIIYAIVAIVIYLALRFDMYFSPGAVFSLINDTLGALCVFIFFRIEFDVPSIAALLTVIGYSINNTVVIYDRIRETLPDNPKKPLTLKEIEGYVNIAINDTLSRTINTTLTTLFASVAIWIFASGSIQNFAIVLSIGITVGAFSSVFVAPAAFLLAKKYLRPLQSDASAIHAAGQPTREDKAKGVV